MSTAAVTLEFQPGTWLEAFMCSHDFL